MIAAAVLIRLCQRLGGPSRQRIIRGVRSLRCACRLAIRDLLLQTLQDSHVLFPPLYGPRLLHQVGMRGVEEHDGSDARNAAGEDALAVGARLEVRERGELRHPRRIARGRVWLRAVHWKPRRVERLNARAVCSQQLLARRRRHRAAPGAGCCSPGSHGGGGDQ